MSSQIVLGRRREAAPLVGNIAGVKQVKEGKEEGKGRARRRGRRKGRGKGREGEGKEEGKRGGEEGGEEGERIRSVYSGTMHC